MFRKKKPAGKIIPLFAVILGIALVMSRTWDILGASPASVNSTLPAAAIESETGSMVGATPSAAITPVEQGADMTSPQAVITEQKSDEQLVGPAVVNYIVLPGDTLSGLAEEYDVTVEQLLELNRGLDPARLVAGQLIKVPDRNVAKEGPRPRFVWPADGPITTPFGQPGGLWIGGYHTGLDIGAGEGDIVWAAGEGVIAETDTNGRNHGYGTYVLIDHGAGWWTLYAHLSRVYRPVGYALRKGEPIGEVGMTGFGDGPHLHFEVWHDTQTVDPKKLDPIQFLP